MLTLKKQIFTRSHPKTKNDSLILLNKYSLKIHLKGNLKPVFVNVSNINKCNDAMSFMRKKLKKKSIENMYHSIIRNAYDSPTTYSVLNGERMKSFPPARISSRCPLSSLAKCITKS